MLKCKDTRIKTQQGVFIHTMYQTGFFLLNTYMLGHHNQHDASKYITL